MQQTVAVLGGGVAGLSAAHELAERGFRVHVYERKQALGGKARSIDVPGSGSDGRDPLPGEHDFRAFLMELFTPLGVPLDEITFFVSRLLIVATSCPERRLTEFEQIAWWDF